MIRNFFTILLFLLCISINAQFTFVPSYTWNALNEPKTFSNKLQLSFVRAADGFPNYGTVMAGGGYTTTQDGATFQLYFPYNEALGGVAPKVRLGLYNNGGWSSWETFFTTANANRSDIDWKAKKLTVSDDITAEGRISLRASTAITGDVISLYGNRLDAIYMYGFGLEDGALYAKTPNSHRWYINKNADLGVSSKMELNNTMLYVADKIGIGTKDTKGYALAVAGKIVTEEVKVALRTSWPDYVFGKEYDLPTLEDVAIHIKQKGHLQNIPSAEEVSNVGINLGEMNSKLLQKIEELTLYIIYINKKVNALEVKDSKLSKDNEVLQAKIQNLESKLK